MQNRRIKFHKNSLFSLAAIAFFWIFWLIAYYAVGNSYVLPSISSTFSSVGKLLGEGGFWRAFGNTFLRTLYAFLFALFSGVSLALVAQLFQPVRAFLAPVVSVLRTVPTMAIILILLLWTTPRVAPVIVSILVLFPAMYSSAQASLDGVGEEYAEFCRTFRIPRGKQAFKVYLPLSAPAVLKQSGGIFSMGLKITVSGEVLSSTYRSIGGLMQEAKVYIEMPRLVALTLLVVLLGFLLEGVCYLLYRLIVRWRHEN